MSARSYNGDCVKSDLALPAVHMVLSRGGRKALIPLQVDRPTLLDVLPGDIVRVVDPGSGLTGVQMRVTREGNDLRIDGLRDVRGMVLAGMYSNCQESGSCRLEFSGTASTKADQSFARAEVYPLVTISPKTPALESLGSNKWLIYKNAALRPVCNPEKSTTTVKSTPQSDKQLRADSALDTGPAFKLETSRQVVTIERPVKLKP